MKQAKILTSGANKNADNSDNTNSINSDNTNNKRKGFEK